MHYSPNNVFDENNFLCQNSAKNTMSYQIHILSDV